VLETANTTTQLTITEIVHLTQHRSALVALQAEDEETMITAIVEGHGMVVTRQYHTVTRITEVITEVITGAITEVTTEVAITEEGMMVEVEMVVEPVAK
jgi:hypothetical protein